MMQDMGTFPMLIVTPPYWSLSNIADKCIQVYIKVSYIYYLNMGIMEVCYEVQSYFSADRGKTNLSMRISVVRPPPRARPTVPHPRCLSLMLVVAGDANRAVCRGSNGKWRYYAFVVGGA